MSKVTTKIFKTSVKCRCNYDDEKEYKTAIGIHGKLFLFEDGSFGMTRSWKIVDKEPYNKFTKPPVNIGDVLKSTNGSIEGMVNLIRRSDNGYTILVGNMELNNYQLSKTFGIYKAVNPESIECIELPHYEKGL